METNFVRLLIFACIFVAFFMVCGSSEPILETQSIYYGLVKTAVNHDNISNCKTQLGKIEEGVRTHQKWALKLLDASGAPETGFYWGNTYWMGSKKQCDLAASLRQARVSPYIKPYNLETNDTIAAFPVSYFSAYFYHNSTLQIFTHWDNETKITLGMCLPASCDEDEISLLLQKYFDSKTLVFQDLYNASFKMDGVLNTGKDYPWIRHPMSIIFIISTILIVIVIILGTSFDIIFYQNALASALREADKFSTSKESSSEENHEKDVHHENNLQNSKPKLSIFLKIILSFSWYTNFNQIFNMTPSPGVMLPINGVRFFMTSFIITSHSYLFVMDYFNNRVNGFFINDSLIGQVYANSSFSVDIFFLLGGFLMVHGLWRSRELADATNLSWRNLIKVYLNALFKRFRRLTPVYLYTLGMTYTISAAHYNSTPMWTNERNDQQCSQYWWTNVLYINNIFPGTYSSMCMSWSYYLSNDMQFYAWVSLLFILSKKYFKTATVLLCATLIGSLTLLGVVTYIDGYQPFPDLFYVKAPLFYYPPWMRIGPYIIGALYGYAYNRYNGKFSLKKIFVWILWIVNLVIILYLLLAFSDRNFPMYFSILHTMFSRNAFAVSFGWIIFACLTGYGGPVNTLLSAKGWMPFSYLTYSAYLLNPILLYVLVTGNDKPWQLETSTITLAGFGMIGLTFLCSTLLVISVEQPLEKVLNLYFDKRKEHYVQQGNSKKNKIDQNVNT